MVWVDILATLIVATLAGMGIGSGGLMVIYLTIFRGAEQRIAQGINLLFFLFASGASMVIHLKRRRVFPLAVGIMIAAGLPAAYLGSRITTLLDESIVRTIFGLFLIAASIPVLNSTKMSKKSQKS
jgi:uncharacterized membrane protein YfcA